MLISELVLKARRILGDVNKQRWTDERMLDIINDGLKDINKFAGVYRNEHFFEFINYQSRYPLPEDLLTVTSVWHNKLKVPIRSRNDINNELFVTKDQLNVGVMEVANPPVYINRLKRFVAGPTDLGSLDSTTLSVWLDDTWTGTGIWTSSTLWGIDSGNVVDVLISPLEGVVGNPLDSSPFGVTEDLSISIDIYSNTPTTPYGLLTAIIDKVESSIPLKTSGETFGILTGVQIATVTATDQSGSVGFVNKPFRVAGRYGTVTSVLKPEEYVRVLYKALPPYLPTLDTAFPLSPSWETPIVNWIVGGALQDDNDASNNARADAFLKRYQRELELGQVDSAEDYSRAGEKYVTKYTGGIRG